MDVVIANLLWMGLWGTISQNADKPVEVDDSEVDHSFEVDDSEVVPSFEEEKTEVVFDGGTASPAQRLIEVYEAD